jgi:putative phage-type endonuclease
MPLTAIRIPYTTEEEWLGLRKEGLGASDVAAAFGLSNFQSPYSLYMEKVGELPDAVPSESMLWGRRLEGAILDEWEVRTGLYAIKRGSLWYHSKDAAWARATVDGMAAESRADIANDPDPLFVVEVKTDFETWDEVPDQYVLQVNWQMHVTGLVEHPAQVVLLPASRRLKIYEVEYDEGLAEEAAVAGKEFWQRVLDKRPPPIDGHPATATTIGRLHPPERAEGEVELDFEVVKAINDLKRLKERVKGMDEDVTKLENVIKDAIGDATDGYYEGKLMVTWRRSDVKGYTVAPRSQRTLLLKK